MNPVSEDGREELHESQRMLASLLSNLPGLAFRCLNDRQWTNLFMSEGCHDLTGYEVADLVGNTRISFEELIHPADRERVWEGIQTALANRQPYQIRYRIQSADGAIKWVSEQGRGIRDDKDNLLFIEGLTIDVTEQIRAEEALRESEARLNLALLASHQGLWDDHPATGQEFVSEEYAKLFGYEPDELMNSPDWWEERIHPEDRDRVLADYDACASGETDGMESEYRFLSKSGEWRWTMDFGKAVEHDDAGRPTRIIGTVADVTDRKLAEQALRESEEKYRRLFELESDAIILVDSESGRIVEANSAASSLYGYGRDEWLTMKYPEMSAEPDESRRAVLERRSHIPLRGHRKKDGTIFPVEIAISHFEWRGRDMHVATMRDISERKRAEAAVNEAEDRLRQSQKMEAVGRLAGGIAHDFNNLLTAILGYSEMILATNLSNPDEVRADLEEIKRAAERAKSLTAQILTFSRRQPREPEVISLNILIREFEPLLRRTLGEDIDVVCLLAPDAGLVEIDPSQFTQVLMNLAVNARDAMAAGGTLTLETANIDVGDTDLDVHRGLAPGRWLEMSVSDIGVGMDEATRERVFEPFFTTKPPGHGTGLGLSTVYGIVQQSGGEIFVNSEPGKGAVFNLYFPIIDRHENNAAPSDELKRSAMGGVAGRPPARTGHGESILVVEDEPGVRALAARILRNEGYKVMLACDGPQAVALAKNGELAFDLLLTDVVLPGGLQGDEVARRVCEERPGLKSIFMSGYPRESIVHSGRLDEGINYLAKPFTPDALTKRVREVLDAD